MKKLQLLTLGLLSASLVLTSCVDDEEDTLGPALTVTEISSNADGGSITINQGDPLAFRWDARKGDSDLETFNILVTGTNSTNDIPMTFQGNEMPYDISNADDENYIDTVVFAAAGTAVGQTNYTFRVTDRDDNTEEVTFDVIVESGSTALSSDQNFTWERVGSTNGTGLAQFGLSWTSNSAQSAIIAADGTSKFVELPAGSYQNITSEEDLAAAIAAASNISEYTGVSAQQGMSNIDDVLATTFNGENFILLVQNSSVSSGTAGTTIEINGIYKN